MLLVSKQISQPEIQHSQRHQLVTDLLPQRYGQMADAFEHIQTCAGVA